MTDATTPARPVVGVDVPWPDRLVIEVTQHDNGEGIARNCKHCPIAIATKRATGRNDVSVGRRKINFGSAEFEAEYRMPEEATKFTEDFDMQEPVSPITFTATLIK